ncbi:hypothetical protein EVAR_54791_1 [Eumeta japonica]|uniref:Uncharacterized protein n=1 Tax=Eumeta variegata TaxID=151549 RepID=A0A4C1Y3F7_EUMVA|nr:hypothetical protein EVAR_54791_1 [Eumeta japonica]
MRPSVARHERPLLCIVTFLTSVYVHVLCTSSPVLYGLAASESRRPRARQLGVPSGRDRPTEPDTAIRVSEFTMNRTTHVLDCSRTRPQTPTSRGSGLPAAVVTSAVTTALRLRGTEQTSNVTGRDKRPAERGRDGHCYVQANASGGSARSLDS